jgi:hypothetical protein
MDGVGEAVAPVPNRSVIVDHGGTENVQNRLHITLDEILFVFVGGAVE